MSGSGGKADVLVYPVECPEIARSRPPEWRLSQDLETIDWAETTCC